VYGLTPAQLRCYGEIMLEQAEKSTAPKESPRKALEAERRRAEQKKANKPEDPPPSETPGRRKANQQALRIIRKKY